MNIAILSTGSRGDVQPYIALGKGLQEAGHVVRLVTHESFEPMTRQHGLDFAPIGIDMPAILTTVQQQGRGDIIADRRAMKREAMRLITPFLAESMQLCWQATDGVDLIILQVAATFIGVPVAEKRGIPTIAAFLQPLTPSTAMHAYAMPPLAEWLTPLAPLYNKVTGLLLNWGMWSLFRGPVQAAAWEALHIDVLSPLKRLRERNALHLHGWSPTLLPRPDDWPQTHHVTGYWFLDHSTSWQIPARLEDFLQAGSPPVYIGFGSMSNRDPERLTQLVKEALQRTRQRGILLSGWGGLKKEDHLSDDLLVIDEAPHDWLFPHMAAVVHHGGAGTTGAGLRAGVPTVIIPHLSDQLFWGDLVSKRGLGPKAIRPDQLTAKCLADAITVAVTDQSIRKRTLEVGKKVRAEDGVGNAVKKIINFRVVLSQ